MKGNERNEQRREKDKRAKRRKESKERRAERVHPPHHGPRPMVLDQILRPLFNRPATELDHGPGSLFPSIYLEGKQRDWHVADRLSV